MINTLPLYLLLIVAIFSGCALDPATEAKFEHALEEATRNSGNANYSALSPSKTQKGQMNACKLAVLNKPKFQDLPMAAISLRPGNDKNHIHFSVRWEGTTGHGNCKVSSNGYVEHVNIKKFHVHQAKHHQGGTGAPKDVDGFYYDRHTGQWRDPDGGVCHSCTPDNGFPAQQHNW